MIRKYLEKDFDSIIDCWYNASLLAHPFLNNEFLEQEKRNIRDIYLPAAETWVFVKDAKVVGYIALLENEIGALFVHPQYHSQGYGKALMEHAKNLHKILNVQVFKENISGRSFYKKCGFNFVNAYMHAESGHMMHCMNYDGTKEEK